MVGKKYERWLQLQVFVRLVQRHVLLFFRGMPGRLFNTVLWMGMMVYLYEYIGFYTVAGYGLFIACAECADYGFYTVFNPVLRILDDIKGPKTITYYLTLPIPQYQVFLSLAVATFIELLTIAALLLPITKIVLQSRFDLSQVAWGQTAAIFICAYLFYASLVLFSTSLIHGVENFNNFYIRIRDSLYWFGCAMFTWQRLYDKSHFLAHVDLLNPFTYACEGMRAAILRDPQAISVWYCCAALLLFTAVCGSIGLHQMMKKLDCL